MSTFLGHDRVKRGDIVRKKGRKWCARLRACHYFRGSDTVELEIPNHPERVFHHDGWNWEKVYNPKRRLIMSEGLILKKGGDIYIQEWDGDAQEHTETFLKDDADVFPHIFEKIIRIDDGFTLTDYFQIFKRYHALQFVEGWTADYLGEFDRAMANPLPKEELANLEYITICQVIEFNDYYSDGNVSVGTYYDVGGMGKPDPEMVERGEVENADELIGWAIEFTPVNKMLHLPIKIEKTIVHSLNNQVDRYEPENIRLVDFMREIIWELSFMGSPEDRDEQSEILNDRFEEAVQDPTVLETIDLKNATSIEDALEARGNENDGE